jgi:hypothetical protein
MPVGMVMSARTVKKWRIFVCAESPTLWKKRGSRNERCSRVPEGVHVCKMLDRSTRPLYKSRPHGCISQPSPSVRLRLSRRRKMKIEMMPNTGAWRVSDVITNGQTSWVEIRTFYGIDEKQAIASFYNTIWSMGWQPL